MTAHLIMPMAGRGSRFAKQGIVEPKPLVTLHGRPFFYWAIRSVVQHLPNCRLSVVILAEHQAQWQLGDRVRAQFSQAEVIEIDSVTGGALDTALLGVDPASDLPVLVNDCDHAFGYGALPGIVEQLASGELSGALAHFAADTPHFSYARYGADGNLLETAEKRVISDKAIAGVYGFANAKTLLAAAETYKAQLIEGEAYVSGVYNSLPAPVRGAMLDWHIPFGTPAEWALAAAEPDRFARLVPR